MSTTMKFAYFENARPRSFWNASKPSRKNKITEPKNKTPEQLVGQLVTISTKDVPNIQGRLKDTNESYLYLDVSPLFRRAVKSLLTLNLRYKNDQVIKYNSRTLELKLSRSLFERTEPEYKTYAQTRFELLYNESNNALPMHDLEQSTSSSSVQIAKQLSAESRQEGCGDVKSEELPVAPSVETMPMPDAELLQDLPPSVPTNTPQLTYCTTFADKTGTVSEIYKSLLYKHGFAYMPFDASKAVNSPGVDALIKAQLDQTVSPTSDPPKDDDTPIYHPISLDKRLNSQFLPAAGLMNEYSIDDINNCTDLMPPPALARQVTAESSELLATYPTTVEELLYKHGFMHMPLNVNMMSDVDTFSDCRDVKPAMRMNLAHEKYNNILSPSIDVPYPVEEPPESAVLNTDMLKTLCGGDTVWTRFEPRPERYNWYSNEDEPNNDNQSVNAPEVNDNQTFDAPEVNNNQSVNAPEVNDNQTTMPELIPIVYSQSQFDDAYELINNTEECCENN